MVKRLLAAAIGLAVLLPTLILGGQRGLEAICAVALLIGLDEYARMAVPAPAGGPDRRALAVFLPVGLGVFAALIWADPALRAPALAAGTLLVLLYGLLGVPETDRGAAVGVRLAAGLAYVPLLLSFIPLIRRFEDGLAWVFLLLAVTWLGDTGAYFAGRLFGKHKLFERVSPKKTWEGAAGGLLFSIAAACVVKAIGLPGLPWVHAVILGALLDVFGILGDLIESLLKRAFGVKDSGWIMPGHGGILDRIDSLLFSAPVAWIYAWVFGLT